MQYSVALIAAEEAEEARRLADQGGVDGAAVVPTRRRLATATLVSGYQLPNTCPDPQPVTIASGVAIPADAVGKDLTFVATSMGATGFACKAPVAGGPQAGRVLGYTISSSSPPTMAPVAGPPGRGGGLNGTSSSSSSTGSASAGSDAGTIAGSTVGVLALALIAGMLYYYPSSSKRRAVEEEREKSRALYEASRRASRDFQGFSDGDVEAEGLHRQSVAGVEMSSFVPPPNRLYGDDDESVAGRSSISSHPLQQRSLPMDQRRASFTVDPSARLRMSMQEEIVRNSIDAYSASIGGGSAAAGFTHASQEELSLYPNARDSFGSAAVATSPMHGAQKHASVSALHSLNPMHAAGTGLSKRGSVVPPPAPGVMRPARLPVSPPSFPPPPLSTSPDDDPNNWEIVIDEDSGEEYYYNATTDTSSWQQPACLAAWGAPQPKKTGKRGKAKARRRSKGSNLASI